MREHSQSTGDALLASWRTQCSCQQRSTNVPVPHKELGAAPIHLMVEFRDSTISVVGYHVTATRA